MAERLSEVSPMTPNDWEVHGRLIDRMFGNPLGTRLTVIAERLLLGLPAYPTSAELLGIAAEATARTRIANGEGPVLDSQRISELASIQTGEEFGDKLV